MKIPNILQKKSDDIWQWVKISSNSDHVNKNDFFGVMSIPRVQNQLRNMYNADPNSLDTKEVSAIFSDVLRSLDSWKSIRLSA
jgi:hypothetical protein